ncbi:MAG: GtrA family protein [Spirochaetia bacterium]|nr:GtrA family protein [Spirochaetia bacterium]
MIPEKYAQPVKFLTVGGINTIVGYGVMFGTYNLLGWDYWLASATNYVVGSLCSFFLNKYFTFQSKKFSAGEVMRFVFCILLCYLIGYGVARPCVRLVFQSASATLQDNLAMLGGSGVFTVLNFFGQKLFVFQKKKEGEE